MNANRLKDTRFILREQLQIERFGSSERCAAFCWDDYEAILNGAAVMARDVFAPANAPGDRTGSRLENGRVVLAEETRQAWQSYRDAGWVGFGRPETYGGSWVPYLLRIASFEYFYGANPALMVLPALTTGAGRLIETFGSAELKNRFVEKLYSGQWTGTMCLTESEAGSDLSRVATLATPNGDAYDITGSKIFITCGDHELADNIVHMVLARTPEAPPGTRGISLFAAPKYRIRPDGSAGEDNDVEATSLEHKLGFRGSPTATLHFGSNGGCRGHLVGALHQGLPQMFQLVNDSRITTGVMGLGLAAEAYSVAVDYAAERVQGTPFGRPQTGAVRIIEHEDVRRMLMHMKALVEGMRVLISKAADTATVEQLDFEGRGNAAGGQLAILTPLVKAWCSDRCHDVCRDAIQTLGGAGYLRDYPVEQILRDSKILSIWEGTNYIQSADLVNRKVLGQQAEAFEEMIEEVLEFSGRYSKDPQLGPSVRLLNRTAAGVRQVAARYRDWNTSSERRRIPWTSTRFLDSLAEVVIGRLLIEQAVISKRRLDEDDSGEADSRFYTAKIVTARYFCTNLLPLALARLNAIESGDASAIDLAEGAF